LKISGLASTPSVGTILISDFVKLREAETQRKSKEANKLAGSEFGLQKSPTPAIVQQSGAQLYDRFVRGIKDRIRTAQIKVALAANAELVLHYGDIGGDILASQKQQGWGAKVIGRLAADLQREFPTLSGCAARNLKYMRAIAEAWPERATVQQLVAQLPWEKGFTCDMGVYAEME